MGLLPLNRKMELIANYTAHIRIAIGELLSIDLAGQGSANCVPGSGNFAAELRDECLNGEIFYSLKEVIIVIEQWRDQYNTIRPHSSLNYRPPAPQTSTAKLLQLERSCTMQ